MSTNNTFTPGPWNIVIPPHGADEVRQTEEPWSLICEFPYGATDGIDAANARLISAAPELLKVALLLDADWTKGFPDGPDTKFSEGCSFADETISLWRAARAAIAKATGESP